MKIVYCIPSCYNSGGMERVLSIKSNYLAEKMGYEVIIITSSQEGKSNYYSFSDKIKFIDLGINYKELEKYSLIKKIYYTIKKRNIHKKKLKNLLNKLKADIVISMFTHEASFLCDIRDGSKKILELHFSKNFRRYDDRYNNANVLKKIISFFLDLRDKAKIHKYDKFIVLSKEDKLGWGNLKNIKVIYNPMPFVPKSSSDIESKQILAVGRLCRQKGFDLLIDIWNNIVKEKKDNGFYISIYGSGPDELVLKEKISKYGLNNTISIKKPTKDIESVYYNSSIFCFTSRYEGFGMALAEAMSCGVAPISFKCPCGPSDIILDKFNGFLINCFNTDDFKEKLLELMNDCDKRKKFGINAIKTIEDKFSIDNIMNQWIDLFKNITK